MSALKLWFDTSELVNTAHLLHSRKLLVWSLDQTGYSAVDAWTSAWTSAFCGFCCVLELFELCPLRLLVSLFHWTTKSPAPVLRDTLIVSTRSWQRDYCITPKAHPCGCSSLNLIKMFERQKLHKLQIGFASVVFALLVLLWASVSSPAFSVSRSWTEDHGAGSTTSDGAGKAGVRRSLWPDAWLEGKNPSDLGSWVLTCRCFFFFFKVWPMLSRKMQYRKDLLRWTHQWIYRWTHLQTQRWTLAYRWRW